MLKINNDNETKKKIQQGEQKGNDDQKNIKVKVQKQTKN